MLQRSPICVGDLKPVGTARPLAVVKPGASLSSLVTISISCFSTLTLFAAGAAWIVPDSVWTFETPSQRPAPALSAQPPSPSTFPSWVEVPHLTSPLAHANDSDSFSVTDEPRSFLDLSPADTVEQLVHLPPRADPHLPLIGRAPLDVTRLTHELPPAWNERLDRHDIATVAPSPVVASIRPDVMPPSQHPAEIGTIRPLPADPAPTPILPPRSSQARAPTDVVVHSAPAIAAVPPLGHVTTLSPNPIQQSVDRTSPVTTALNTGVVVAPVFNPGPAKHARSLRRPGAAIAASRVRAPYRDTEQTASIIGRPTSTRGRIDTGAVAHASVHRLRTSRSASSSASAPSSSWTLPPALAPTD